MELLSTIFMELLYVLGILAALILIYAIVITILHDIYKRITIVKFTKNISKEDLDKAVEELKQLKSTLDDIPKSDEIEK